MIKALKKTETTYDQYHTILARGGVLWVHE